MKLKYYLRGLGIGIIVTTILLMIAFALHKPTMSDADIIARAKQLGMVMPEDEEPLQDTETTESTEVTAVPETEAAQIEEQTTEAAAVFAYIQLNDFCTGNLSGILYFARNFD